MGTHPIFESDFDCLTVTTIVAEGVLIITTTKVITAAGTTGQAGTITTATARTKIGPLTPQKLLKNRPRKQHRNPKYPQKKLLKRKQPLKSLKNQKHQTRNR